MASRHIILNIKQIKGIGDIAYIKHGNWSVCIDSHGAHVLGLFFKEKNLLHYNPADMEHSGIPICMPNFGPLINDIFEYQGADFAITQHGFFRDFGYQLLSNSATSATYQLNSNPETRQRFPFDFCFIVTFSVDDSGLTAVLSLTNKSDSSMPIAPGIHPYYAVAEGEDVVFETRAQAANDNNQDYADVFIEDSLEVLFESKSGPRRVRVIGKPDLHLKGHGLDETRLTIGSNPVLTITADLTSFNRMTVWRKETDSPFICLEPAFVKNGLNDQPISIPAGETWGTVFQIAR
jgi:galactose mutarotase-like enzyme